MTNDFEIIAKSASIAHTAMDAEFEAVCDRQSIDPFTPGTKALYGAVFGLDGSSAALDKFPVGYPILTFIFSEMVKRTIRIRKQYDLIDLKNKYQEWLQAEDPFQDFLDELSHHPCNSPDGFFTQLTEIWNLDNHPVFYELCELYRLLEAAWILRKHDLTGSRHRFWYIVEALCVD